MSDSTCDWARMGAYGIPFSGNGMEFFPLGVPLDHSGVVLHESGYMAARPCWNYPNVLSPFWRLYYDLKPGHKVVFSQREVILGPDRLVLIPDHSLFHAVGTRSRPKFWLAFNCARRPVPEQAIPIELMPSAIELALIRELIALFESPSREQHRSRIFHFSLALLHEVLGRSEIGWLDEKPDAVLRAIRLVEERYSDPLYNHTLAQTGGLSESAFNRLFRLHQGISPGQFIAQVRVREAAHLLMHSLLSLDDVAEQCGFPNRVYLTRVFTRIVGEPPARFRRRHAR